MKFSKLRISVTSIEQFNRFLLGLLEEEALIEQIKKPFETNDYFEVGKAWHSVIENYHQYKNHKGSRLELPIYDEEKECSFSIQDVRKIENLMPDSTLHEFKKVLNLKYSDYDIELVGKCDGIVFGNLCFEHKTTTKDNQRESYYQKYYDSFQWRFYCYIFNVDTVIYNIFLYSKEIIQGKGDVKTRWYVDVKEPVRLLFTKPENNSDECIEILHEFVDFIHQHNLQEYYQPYEYKQENRGVE